VPHPRMRRRAAVALAGDHHHEFRQILVLAAERVSRPRAPRRAPELHRSREEDRHRGLVEDVVGLDRANEAELVRHRADVGEELREPHPTFPVVLELERGADDRKRALLLGDPRDPLTAPDRVGKLLAAPLIEERLLVEEVHLREAAREEDEDHPLRGGLGEEERRGLVAKRHSRERFAPEHARERDGAEAESRLPKERAAAEIDVGCAAEEKIGIAIHGISPCGSSRRG
jgi:hypothetical protein